MSNKFKDINIKKTNIFSDTTNIENFDPNNIKIDEKSYKNILIYYIGHMTFKKFWKMYSVDPLFLFFRYVNEHFEEINVNKY